MAKPVSNNEYKDEEKDKEKEYSDLFKVNPDWICPICRTYMRKPVHISGESSKHVFCEECITIWNNNNPTNPLTNKLINKDKNKIKYIRNYELEKEIKSFIKRVEIHPSKLANDIFNDELSELRPLVAKYKRLQNFAKNIPDALKNCFSNSKKPQNINKNNNNNNNTKINNQQLQTQMALLDEMNTSAKQEIDDITQTAKEILQNSNDEVVNAQAIEVAQEQITGIKRIVAKFNRGLKRYWNKFKNWCIGYVENFKHGLSQVKSISYMILKQSLKIHTGNKVAFGGGAVGGAIIGGVVGVVGGPAGIAAGVIIGGIVGGTVSAVGTAVAGVAASILTFVFGTVGVAIHSCFQ